MKKIRFKSILELSDLQALLSGFFFLPFLLVGFSYINFFIVWEPIPAWLIRSTVFVIPLLLIHLEFKK